MNSRPGPDHDEAVIVLRDIDATYRREEVLRGVSLTILRGQFLGIIGPNGAGKTTLLTVINGMLRPRHGQVEVLGRRLGPTNGGQLRRRIGYVLQGQNTDPRLPMTVRESALMGSFGRIGPLRRIPAATHTLVDELLECVGIAHLRDRPVGHLSGGERQRVAIARALVQQPEILLLDEPTNSLDMRSQRSILDLIERIHARFALTTLMVTHDLNTLPPSCDRLLFVKQGRIVWQGEPMRAMTEQRLSRLYQTPVTLTWHGQRPSLLF
jgi:ABC-type cobalamin/Fe3+-siderophores transport system ATPase subunit